MILKSKYNTGDVAPDVDPSAINGFTDVKCLNFMHLKHPAKFITVK